MKRRLYFAYGSNLDQAQMKRRCPRARLIGKAVLPSYRLTFGGHSRMWGGAVATVKRDRNCSVDGLLYDMPQADFDRLDAFEGCPAAYIRVRRVVYDDRERARRPLLYIQRKIIDEKIPSAKYFMVLLDAYDTLGFDRRELFRAAGVER
jgi:gamma-glutamylcyclotransferase (GGCT)/AIG2-like uncharacterized protein YtfP